jgi:hypothetical protein
LLWPPPYLRWPLMRALMQAPAWPMHMIKRGEFSGWPSVITTDLRSKLASLFSVILSADKRFCFVFYG